MFTEEMQVINITDVIGETKEVRWSPPPVRPQGRIRRIPGRRGRLGPRWSGGSTQD